MLAELASRRLNKDSFATKHIHGLVFPLSLLLRIFDIEVVKLRAGATRRVRNIMKQILAELETARGVKPSWSNVVTYAAGKTRNY
jgi:hypothetical protein